jgi:chromosome partitioning protein
MIISVINQKGGVAKTTSTFNLAAALGQLGKKVLMIDLDPQSSLTISTGIEPEELDTTIYNVLCERRNIEDVIIQFEDYDLVPAVIDLSVAEMQLVTEFGRENILKKAISNIKDKYDYIFIDCPPSLGLLTVNALCASDKVLVPVATEYLALRGMNLLFDTIAKIKENLNEKIEVLGIIPTMYDKRTLHAKEVLEKLRTDYVNLVFEPISKSVQVQDAVLNSSTIVNDNPNHKIAKMYKKIAEEILNG